MPYTFNPFTGKLNVVLSGSSKILGVKALLPFIYNNLLFLQFSKNTLLKGLLAFYKLSNLSDSSGNNNTLTNIGGVSFSAGKIGDAANFNGSNYLIKENTFTGETSASFFCWGKITSMQDVNAYGMAGTSGDGSWLLFYHNLNQELRFAANIVDIGWGDYLTVPTVIAPNEWVQVGFTYNGTIAKIYKNGQLIGSQEISGNFANSLNNIYIGIEGSWETITYTGQIDAVGIWNRALSDTEVTSLYNNGNGRELP